MTLNSGQWASRSRNGGPNMAKPALARIWTPPMNAQLDLDPPAGDPNPPPAERASREGPAA